ncbi:MAG: hypothetical protein JOZ11_15595 [Alphaproteobacteria bacterium]|nr:hypothetical protein [Alphaproteobacteria bacterium]
MNAPDATHDDRLKRRTMEIAESETSLLNSGKVDAVIHDSSPADEDADHRGFIRGLKYAFFLSLIIWAFIIAAIVWAIH